MHPPRHTNAAQVIFLLSLIRGIFGYHIIKPHTVSRWGTSECAEIPRAFRPLGTPKCSAEAPHAPKGRNARGISAALRGLQEAQGSSVTG